ncbi:type VI secretion system tube protein Hcp [bacterium]|nr:MAG: type VI secretion system tube protein Hcp [bacterium]
MGTSAYAQQKEDVHLSLKASGVEIKGEVIQKGRENSIECFGYEQETQANPTGRRTYQPLVIRKRIDKASPLLMKALIKNENISATFKFYRTPQRGTAGSQASQEHYYTVTLSDARILSVRQVMPDTRESNAGATTEEVQFGFSKINWTYTVGGVSMDDDNVQMTGSSNGAVSGLRVRPSQ